MRLIQENSFNWRYVYTHLIFFKITSLSINTPLPAVLPHVVACLEVLNWDLLQSIRHSSLHVSNSPKMASFQAGFEQGKQKEKGQGQRCPNLPTAQTWPHPISFCFPGSNAAWKDNILGLLKMCRLLWRMLCKRTQFKTSRRATTCGRTAGNSVLILKDVTLKNIKCVWTYLQLNEFSRISLITFQAYLVHLKKQDL